MRIPFGMVDWIDNLRFDKEREVALIADVGKFLDCTMRVDGQHYAVMCSDGTKRGWIQYDIEEGGDLCKERCVVVGKVDEWENVDEVSNEDDEDDEDDYSDDEDENEDDEGLKDYYYMLVVRPTSVGGEFSRVGVGLIQSDYVVRQRRKVRVV